VDNLTPLQQRAKILLDRGVPVLLVREGQKDAFEFGFQTNPITNFDDPRLREPQYANCNTGALAQAKIGGVWFFEADDRAVLEKIKQDTGHGLNEAPTLVIESRDGHWHFYFQQTEASIKMGNVPQLYGPFSGRVNNQYVVGPDSHRNDLNRNYLIVIDKPIAPAPDWFVQWVIDQRTKNKSSDDGGVVRNEAGKIPHGFIHGWMVHKAGVLRNMGASIETLTNTLLDLVHDNCEPPIDDDKVRQVSRSFERYETNADASLQMKLNQQPDNGVIVPATDEEVEVPTFEPEPYPEFPTYVMSGTSLHKNLVQPWIEHNSRIDYFLWLPATAMLANYLSRKVAIKSQFAAPSFNGSIYMALIGKRGDTNKSSCVEDGMAYFDYMGCLTQNGGGLKTAEGKTVVFTPGSSEGLGLEMQKTNCKNGLVYYDELKKLVSKAGIDGSALGADLLTMYEGKKFANGVKKTKEAFSLEPNSYSMSLITCCTDTTFKEQWMRMCGEDTGLNDRFIFVLQPEQLPTRRIKTEIDARLNSAETRALIDKAIQQETFEVENWNNRKLQELIELGDRGVDRAFKWALAIAVDSGRTIIDDESLDRGVDIVRYEVAVKNYLKAEEQAETREASVQLRIMDKLRGNGGSMRKTVLEDQLNAERMGTTLWSVAFYGLQKSGKIRTLGKGAKGDPIMVQLLYKKNREEAA
jgi:hypothetical protein